TTSLYSIYTLSLHDALPILEIIQRAKTDFTGTIDIAKSYAFFLPDDRKMIHDIFVPLDNLNGAQHGEKVVVSITEWPKNAKNPRSEEHTSELQSRENLVCRL